MEVDAGHPCLRSFKRNIQRPQRSASRVANAPHATCVRVQRAFTAFSARAAVRAACKAVQPAWVVFVMHAGLNCLLYSARLTVRESRTLSDPQRQRARRRARGGGDERAQVAHSGAL